jgi:hypothetical protein
MLSELLVTNWKWERFLVFALQSFVSRMARRS